MGVNCKLYWTADMEVKPQSKRGGNEYRSNSAFGGGSPTSIQSSLLKRSRNRFSYSEQSSAYNDIDVRAQSKTDSGRRNKTCDKCLYSKNKSCETETGVNNKMALSAVMMSGSSGAGKGLRKGSSHRITSETDSEQENSTIWNFGDKLNPGTRSRSVSPMSSKCSCDKAKAKETVMINVGGTVFETFKSTLKRLNTCKLADEQEMMKYHRAETGDFFFDRDPYAFSIILNYLRYGDLHLPTNLCGPALMREFQYWGVDEQDIERCCFQPYNTWKTQTKSLEKLEYDRKQSTTQTDLGHDRKSSNVLRRMRAVVWPFLQDPSSSSAAKMYAWISIIFVGMSIFSFCAETHPYFQLPPSEVHTLRNLYKFFALEDSHVISESRQRATQSRNNDTDASDVTQTNNAGAEQTIQHPALLVIDLICVLFFSLEFLTRLAFCPKKIRFCKSLQNVIDFIAIVPDYAEFLILAISPQIRSGLDFIFILRMLRLCRIFRLIRHVPGLWILLYTLKASFNELLLMFVFLLIGMVMFASLLHFTEGGEQFSNIPVGFWWAVVTMTTVGYGDMYPTTAFGYFIGSICAISGLLMIAFTVPIIVSNFVLYYTHVQYGISDKDDRPVNLTCDATEDNDTCSFHTSCTESIYDEAKGQNPRNSQISVNDMCIPEIELKHVPSISSGAHVGHDIEGNIPMETTDNNSNKL